VPDLSVQVGTLALTNPIMPASGTFSEDLARVFDIGVLGAHVTKTITANLRDGNPVPRICEINDGMLNSIGIPSKGVQYFLDHIVPFYAVYDTPLVVSVSAGTAAEFADICRRVTVPGVAAIEANISCPNIEEDGKAFAWRAHSTHDAMVAMREATHLPLWAKLTPNTSDTADVARAAEDAGADALVVANTMLGMAVDIESRKPRLGNIMGGISGAGMKPIALRMTFQCVHAVDIPVIGCGGIASAEDALEFMMVGAVAVQVGTATFRRPTAMRTILDDLGDWLDAHGIARVQDVIGTLSVGDEMVATAERYEEA